MFCCSAEKVVVCMCNINAEFTIRRIRPCMVIAFTIIVHLKPLRTEGETRRLVSATSCMAAFLTPLSGDAALSELTAAEHAAVWTFEIIQTWPHDLRVVSVLPCCHQCKCFLSLTRSTASKVPALLVMCPKWLLAVVVLSVVSRRVRFSPRLRRLWTRL